MSMPPDIDKGHVLVTLQRQLDAGTSSASKDEKKSILRALSRRIAALRDEYKLIQQSGAVMSTTSRNQRRDPYTTQMLQHSLDRYDETIQNELRCDPLLALPPELLLMVFGECSFLERIFVRRVSRRWRDLIDDTPDFWSSLWLATSRPWLEIEYSRQIPIDFVRRAIEASGQKATDVTIGQLRGDYNETIRELVAQCPIRIMIFSHAHKHNYEANILEQAKHLKTVHFPRVWSGRPPMVRRMLEPVSQQLEVISYHVGWRPPKCWRDYDGDWPEEPVTMLNLPNLTWLYLSTLRYGFATDHNGGALSIAQRMPNLKTLCLCHGHMSEDDVMEDLRPFNHLQHLSLVAQYKDHLDYQLPEQLISFRTDLYPDSIWSQLQLPKLEELTLRSMRAENLHKLSISLLPILYPPIAEPRLRELNCSFVFQVEPHQITVLSAILQHPRLMELEQLELSADWRQDPEIQHGAVELSHFHRLRYLDTHGMFFDQATIEKQSEVQGFEWTHCEEKSGGYLMSSCNDW